MERQSAIQSEREKKVRELCVSIIQNAEKAFAAFDLRYGKRDFLLDIAHIAGDFVAATMMLADPRGWAFDYKLRAGVFGRAAAGAYLLGDLELTKEIRRLERSISSAKTLRGKLADAVFLAGRRVEEQFWYNMSDRLTLRKCLPPSWIAENNYRPEEQAAEDLKKKRFSALLKSLQEISDKRNGVVAPPRHEPRRNNPPTRGHAADLRQRKVPFKRDSVAC